MPAVGLASVRSLENAATGDITLSVPQALRLVTLLQLLLLLLLL